MTDFLRETVIATLRRSHTQGDASMETNRDVYMRRFEALRKQGRATAVRTGVFASTGQRQRFLFH